MSYIIMYLKIGCLERKEVRQETQGMKTGDTPLGVLGIRRKSVILNIYR